jgi:heptosyltransferase-1
MGDVIHTLPAVAALRNALPDLRIGWIIEHRWAELLCAKNAPRFGPRSLLRPVVDFVHIVDTKGWRKSLLAPGTSRQIAEALREVRDQHYEIAVDFQGALKSAVIARLTLAETVFGMKDPREWPAQLLHTNVASVSGAHVIEQYHSLAEAVAGRSLPKHPSDFPSAENSPAITPQGRLAIINPGAGWAAKQWPAERYGEVAKALAAHGITPVINFGPGEDELAQAAESASGGTAHRISCSIEELIALTRHASLFIGGDTGPLHLAAALRVPVVAIYGPTDPARNGPYSARSVVLRSSKSRTSLSHTGEPDPGLLEITPDEVISAARSLLEESAA